MIQMLSNDFDNWFVVNATTSWGGTKEVFQFNYEKLPQSSVKIFASHTNQGFNLYLGDSNELRVLIMD